CNFTARFWAFSPCGDPTVHLFHTSVEGSRKWSCPDASHKKIILCPGLCPLC
ncbi:hypothetical protein B0T14DRAFT_400293, partial [Immersiella caudata]